MSFAFSMQVWGSLRAPRRALLLHGGVESATSWSKVAKGLVDAGYRVDAPDLDGHGWTGATNVESTYKHFVDHLVQNLEADAKYDVVGGISLGSLTAIHLYPKLSFKPKKLVLVEPPLGSGVMPPIDAIAQMLANPPPVEALMKANHRTVVEASADRLGLLQIDVPALRTLLTSSGFQPHSDLPTADASKETVITVIAADPAHRSLYSKDNVEALKKERPHVRAAWVPGASHSVHKDKPEAILQVILKDQLEKSDVLEPL